MPNITKIGNCTCNKIYGHATYQIVPYTSNVMRLFQISDLLITFFSGKRARGRRLFRRIYQIGTRTNINTGLRKMMYAVFFHHEAARNSSTVIVYKSPMSRNSRSLLAWLWWNWCPAARYEYGMKVRKLQILPIRLLAVCEARNDWCPQSCWMIKIRTRKKALTNEIIRPRRRPYCTR